MPAPKKLYIKKIESSPWRKLQTQMAYKFSTAAETNHHKYHSLKQQRYYPTVLQKSNKGFSRLNQGTFLEALVYRGQLTFLGWWSPSSKFSNVDFSNRSIRIPYLHLSLTLTLQIIQDNLPISKLLIISAKSLLPLKVIYEQVPGLACRYLLMGGGVAHYSLFHR